MRLYPLFLLLFISYFIACDVPKEPGSVQLDLTNISGLGIFGEEVISTGLNERDLAISPAGDEILYTIVSPRNRVSYIVQLTKKDEGWSRPEMAAFSGQYNDLEPAFHPNGEELFFASKRPMSESDESNDYNIWKVNKEADGRWSEAIALEETINTEGDEFYPSVAANGNLYFTASYEGGKGSEDIYLSRFENGEYQEPESLSDSINTKTFEFNAYVAPNENFLIFSSFGRPDGEGGGDLYISEKDDNGKWMGARHLKNGINSKGLDYCPFVHVNSGMLYFTSDRTPFMESPGYSLTLKSYRDKLNSAGNGNGDIYRIPLSKVNDN